MVRRPQNTRQQVDGAVFEYEQRCQSLLRLLRDAQDVQRLLSQQLEAHRKVADQAQQQVAESADEEAVCVAAERQLNLKTATLLEQQLAQQRDELESMKLALAKAKLAV